MLKFHFLLIFVFIIINNVHTQIRHGENNKLRVDSIAIIKDYIKENNIFLTPIFEPLKIPVQPTEGEGVYEFKFSIYDDARLLFDNYQIFAELADRTGRFCDSLSKLKLIAIYKPCKNFRMENLTTEIIEGCYVDDNLQFTQEIRPERSYITMQFYVGLLNYLGFFDCHTYNSLYNNNAQDYWLDRAFKIKIRGVKILNNGAKIYGPLSAYRLPSPIKIGAFVSKNY